MIGEFEEVEEGEGEDAAAAAAEAETRIEFFWKNTSEKDWSKTRVEIKRIEKTFK